VTRLAVGSGGGTLACGSADRDRWSCAL